MPDSSHHGNAADHEYIQQIPLASTAPREYEDEEIVEGRITSAMTPREVGQELIRVMDPDDAYDIKSWLSVNGPDEIKRKLN
jgi:hypothetical protein